MAERIFAIRALGRASDPQAGKALAQVLRSDAYTPPERAEAARALASLRAPGQAALAEALAAVAPDAPKILRGLTGSSFGVLLAIMEALGDDAAARAESTLWTLARLELGPDSGPPWLRRASMLRCLAAEKLARGAWDSDILVHCDVGDGQAGERARLSALDRAPLAGARRAAWLELVRSKHVKVREAALGMISRHRELGAEARAAHRPGARSE